MIGTVHLRCADGRPQACLPGDPIDEQCNGADDDCDGEVDEDAIAGGCGVGACYRDAGCVDGAPTRCAPGVPTDEVCNDVDDDCNGAIDDGFRAASVSTLYSVLVGIHPGCDGVSQRMSPDCNAAMHRFCRDQDCKTSGFGPQHSSGIRSRQPFRLAGRAHRCDPDAIRIPPRRARPAP